jgi:hypothetical protein
VPAITRARELALALAVDRGMERPLSYSVRALGLVACPFCRELFQEGEATACPVCGVDLAPFEKLGASPDGLAEDEVPVEPEKEILPPTYFGRCRGPLALAGLAGVALFFLPWIHVTLPDIAVLSGFSLARRLVWVWTALAAWVVLVPTVLSRRSIWQMRTARVAAGFLSAIPAMTALVLLLRPPKSRLLPVVFTYEWPIWATLGLSLIAVGLAVRLGGRMDDIRLGRGTSRGHELH